MAGEHLRKLEQWVAGMEPDDVSTSGAAWATTALSLGNVRTALATAAADVKEGFGDNPDGVGATAYDAFTATATRIEEQEVRMEKAATALVDVHGAMKAAKTTKEGAPAEPGPAPRPEDYPDYHINPLSMLEHAVDSVVHSAAVTSYNQADADAKARIEELTTKYDDAVAVLSEIHGDPYVPMDPEGTPGPGGPAGPGPGRGPGRGPRPGNPTDPVRPGEVVEWPPIDGGEEEPVPPRDEDPPIDESLPPRDPVVTTPLPLPVDEGGGLTPTPIGGGGGGGLNPGLVGGGLAAAGVLGAPGLVNGIRGLLNRGGSLSGGAGAIGSSTRTGGPGALGRSGAGTVPGTPVGRGGGGGGAGGGRGGGRGGGAAGGRGAGVPGSAAGRGGSGARGVGVGVGAGGRGRGRRDDDQVQGRDLFDDGQDWIDDEGTAPGVLG
ncbi:hypothetical protein [Nocardioides sp. SYSU DS0651]|uniref:hypothetical protein n=1 Tax=Nocardioides sp. SYSU DS0651 TaxID=3415955 RepID=UPI003F4BFE7C